MSIMVLDSVLTSNGTLRNGHVEGPLTAEDYETSYDRKQFELIDGFVVEKPLMSVLACRIKSKLHIAMGTFCEQHPTLGEALTETPFILFPQQRKTVRVPDVAFVKSGKLPDPLPSKGDAQGAPDLAVEVVSPTDLADSIDEKLSAYFQAGTSLIWIVYPQTRSIHVFRRDGSASRLTIGQTLDGEDVMPGFQYPLISLFPA